MAEETNPPEETEETNPPEEKNLELQDLEEAEAPVAEGDGEGGGDDHLRAHEANQAHDLLAVFLAIGPGNGHEVGHLPGEEDREQ